MKTRDIDSRSRERYAVILAGGRGERFWPVSRARCPKQLLSLLGRRSFLQEAVDRVRAVVPLANVLVITNDTQKAAVRRQLPELPPGNIIAEPCGRDTCAAVTLGAAIVGARSTAAIMAFLPADHVVAEPKKFQRVLADCYDLAGRGQVMVTIGIKPTEPATGYGYIQVGPPMPPPRGARAYTTNFFKAERFVEKPDAATAVGYLATGNYRWNAGMFVWSFVTITESLAQHQPEMAQACQRWFRVAGTPRLARLLAEDYPRLKRISIDYALMEHARNVAVAAGDFAWDDLGSWSALARHLKTDAEGNSAVADFLHVDAARNLVYDARTKQRHLIALVGVRDAIVVLTDDATLVAQKTHAQQVKEVVNRLAASPPHRALL
jgi:mannose-1-phosphate guanylyltransferase